VVHYKKGYLNKNHYVMDLINTLPGNSSVNTVRHATIEKAVFSLDSTDTPIDWLNSDHVKCVYCRSSLFCGYINDRICSGQLRVTSE
jgi:hypothetical protein